MNAANLIRRTVERYPRIKSVLKAIVAPFRPGSGSRYSRVAADDVKTMSRRLRDAWRDNGVPLQQRRGVERQLTAYRTGRPNVGFDSLANMVRPLVDAREVSKGLVTLLEVGCSSGYHSEALAIKGLQVAYSGCDFSPYFIDMARRCYPLLDFQVQDATRLEYHDDSFDIVLSGCCLLHIEDFEAAIRETARVTRAHAIFHRTPILQRNLTSYYTKRAYGVDMLEIHFNEEQLISLFRKHDLMVAGISTLYVDWRNSDAFTSKTYLCRKVRV